MSYPFDVSQQPPPQPQPEPQPEPEAEEPPPGPAPGLVQNWNPDTPHMTGDPRYLRQPGEGETPPDAPDPSVAAYTVSPGSLRAASDAILADAGAAVTQYETVRAYIAANSHWVFTAANPNAFDPYEIPIYPVADIPQYGDHGRRWQSGRTRNIDPDTLPTMTWQQGDRNPEWTAAFTDASNALLNGVAAVVTLAGQYLDMINNAGQFYTMADENSFMPELNSETP